MQRSYSAEAVAVGGVAPGLAAELARCPYDGYVYSYPHKSAYRPLAPARDLRSLWKDEDRSVLSLYLHIPFCEMRCGFCNLFTLTERNGASTSAYLRALERQGRVVREKIGNCRIMELAIGGGTPTLLSPGELERLLVWTGEQWGVALDDIPGSIETSPATATAERLRVLRDHGIERVSIGVQSFVEAEVRGVGRAQRTKDVLAALDRIRSLGFPILNIDLIYGLPDQDRASWSESLNHALAYRPQEIYLYPLYVRPLTGLDRTARDWDDRRLDLYRCGRDRLLDAGYRQLSMRAFRQVDTVPRWSPHRCQRDGMVGLGCGARSYTDGLHYSHPFGVVRRRIDQILADYLAVSDRAHGTASHGVDIDTAERQRRWLLKTLLLTEGLCILEYRQRFSADPMVQYPDLMRLKDAGLAFLEGDRLTLSPRGMELSDAIGPWLFSASVRARMQAQPLQ